MLTVKEVYEAIDAFAPFASQESWDNSGLLVGGMAQPADRILTTLDISEAIVAQAVAEQVQLVVAHHPVIFFAAENAAAGQSGLPAGGSRHCSDLCAHAAGHGTAGAEHLCTYPFGKAAGSPGYTGSAGAVVDGRQRLRVDRHQCPHMDTANAGTDAANGIRGSAVFRRRAFHSENCLLFRLGCVHAGTGCGKGL